MAKPYAALSALLAPLVPLWLLLRWFQGKEEAGRWRERLGIPSLPRPSGTLLWLHAASVGEANSVLPLIHRLRARWPAMHLLLTTGTRTSAMLMRTHLPKGVLHQYVPVDTPQATERFMRHWRPDLAFLVESEFWPNLIAAANDWRCFTGVINARLSERSFAFWQKYPAMIAGMLKALDVVFAQSEDDAARLRALGARNVRCVGNIKYDADPLPCDESMLLTFKTAIGARPVWLAASTHPGEETKILQAHLLMAATKPDLLTLIVPRHPERGGKIAEALSGRFPTGLRSHGDAPSAGMAFYVADTLGELGLFYRLSDVVFMGGSLVSRGGQNPLEPARLSCAVLTGPHTHNFSDMYREMERADACIRVTGAPDLAAQAGMLLSSAARRQPLQANAKRWAESRAGATDVLLEALRPLLDFRPATAEMSPIFPENGKRGAA